MRFMFLAAMTLCEAAGDDGTGGNAGGGGGGPVPAPTQEEGEIKFTSKQLDARLKRATSAELKDLFGTDDRDAIKTQWQKAKDLEAAEEERKRLQMSEIERYQVDLAKEKEASARTAAELAEVKFTQHITENCATLGIKSLKYARFLVSEAAEELPDGQQLDVTKFLTERLADPQHAAALGIVQAPPVVTPKGVSTSPEPAGGTPPVPSAAPLVPTSGKTVAQMNKSEFNAHLANLGVGAAGT
ncbi:hypothetical protein UFOVP650_47 [uncultured Caudovirales phage]|uniref:Uncharacterized protein n=1 Tax=uncultured Caudovirales phage TaxID=2100421 RepID=A0A6J5N748_9CAUD|nr:hypothetical protein UFOVP650_47 [uncultured Caudovirales phage]